MLVLAKQAFLWREEIRLPTKALPESSVSTCCSKPVNFASLTDNFTLLFSKLFKLILNANTANIEQLFGPEKLSELSRNGPLVVKSLRPPTAWTSSECKWLNVDVGLVRFMFVVLEKNTLASTKGGWFT